MDLSRKSLVNPKICRPFLVPIPPNTRNRLKTKGQNFEGDRCRGFVHFVAAGLPAAAGFQPLCSSLASRLTYRYRQVARPAAGDGPVQSHLAEGGAEAQLPVCRRSGSYLTGRLGSGREMGHFLGHFSRWRINQELRSTTFEIGPLLEMPEVIPGSR